jgi:hypothetical protein
VINLLTTLGLSEISYLSTKFISIYTIFTAINRTFSNILIATILAWIIYLAIANIMIKRTKLVKENK